MEKRTYQRMVKVEASVAGNQNPVWIAEKDSLAKEMCVFQDQGQGYSFLYLQLCPVDCAWHIEDP